MRAGLLPYFRDVSSVALFVLFGCATENRTSMATVATDDAGSEALGGDEQLDGSAPGGEAKSDASTRHEDAAGEDEDSRDEQRDAGSAAPGAVETVVDFDAEYHGVQLALDPAFVYWTEVPASGEPSFQRILKASVGGGDPELLATEQKVSPSFQSLVAYDGRLYFSAHGGVGSIATSGESEANAFASGDLVSAIAVRDGVVYWTTRPGAVMSKPVEGDDPPTTLATDRFWATGIAVDAALVYWTNNGDDTVKAVPLTGGAPVTLIEGLYNPNGLVVTRSSIYVRDIGVGGEENGPCGGAGIGSAPIAGGKASCVAYTTGGFAVDADDEYVYWSDGPRILKALVGGGQPVVLVDDYSIDGIKDLAVSDEHVYWLTLWRIQRVPK